MRIRSEPRPCVEAAELDRRIAAGAQTKQEIYPELCEWEGNQAVRQFNWQCIGVVIVVIVAAVIVGLTRVPL